MIEVTQADREAVSAKAERNGALPITIRKLLLGWHDHWEAVQAEAKRRLAAATHPTSKE